LQLVKKFPAFHGTRRFITALTSFRHLSLSWASPIQSIYPHPTYLEIHSNIHPSTPRSPQWFLPSAFPTKTLHTPLSSPIRATCPAHLIIHFVVVQATVNTKIKMYHELGYGVSSFCLYTRHFVQQITLSEVNLWGTHSS